MNKFANEKASINMIVEAMKSGDEQQMQNAWASLHESVAERVRADFADLQESHDAAVLAQRGYRQLTTAETKWYQKVIDAMRSDDPKQAFISVIGTDAEDGVMPATIIEDVYKHLRENHPLLQVINFRYVGYVTKWILNDHAAQNAVWGKITDAIAKEITSSFKVVDVDQNKLSAYAIIELGMLDLGPVFLDSYIREVLSDALMAGIEIGIVSGNGVDSPIGMIRDISEDVSYSPSTGYPEKTPVPVNDFTPASYGALVGRMAKTENGKARRFTKVYMLCNQTDYLTKIMPATTVLNANGAYVNDLFPFPTEVIISNALEDGKAVLFLKDEYSFLVGGAKNGVIEYSDECKFIEDQRVFKIKQYGAGRAYDDTSALYLDISDVEPAYITVKNYETVNA